MVAGRADQAESPPLGCSEHERDRLDARPAASLRGKIGAGRNPGVRVEHSAARRLELGDPAKVLGAMHPPELFDRSPRGPGSLDSGRDSPCARDGGGSPAAARAARGGGPEPDGRASGGSVNSPTAIAPPGDLRSTPSRALADLHAPRIIAEPSGRAAQHSRDADRAFRTVSRETHGSRSRTDRRARRDLPDRRPPLESVAMKPTPPRLDSGRTREILVVVAFTADRRAAPALVARPARARPLRRRDLRASGLWIFSRHGILGPGPDGHRLRSARVSVPGRAVLLRARRRRLLGDPGLDRRRDPDDPGGRLAGPSDLRQRGRGGGRGLRRALGRPHRVLAHGAHRRLVPALLAAGADRRDSGSSNGLARAGRGAARPRRRRGPAIQI